MWGFFTPQIDIFVSYIFKEPPCTPYFLKCEQNLLTHLKRPFLPPYGGEGVIGGSFWGVGIFRIGDNLGKRGYFIIKMEYLSICMTKIRL